MAERSDDQTDPGLLDRLPQAVTEADEDSWSAWEFATFSASKLAFCPRQAYLSTLGLRDTSEFTGSFATRRLLQTHLEELLADHFPDYEIAPRISFSDGGIRVVGRCTAIDPASDTVYHIKPRNGWYRYHPPVERHVNQLHLYLRAADVSRGRLLSASMADLSDLRAWPPRDTTPCVLERDPERIAALVTRAQAIRDTIVAHGVPTAAADIPFDSCGCYLCDTEALDLPEPALSSAAIADIPIREAPLPAPDGTPTTPVDTTDPEDAPAEGAPRRSVDR